MGDDDVIRFMNEHSEGCDRKGWDTYEMFSVDEDGHRWMGFRCKGRDYNADDGVGCRAEKLIRADFVAGLDGAMLLGTTDLRAKLAEARDKLQWRKTSEEPPDEEECEDALWEAIWLGMSIGVARCDGGDSWYEAGTDNPRQTPDYYRPWTPPSPCATGSPPTMARRRESEHGLSRQN